MRKSYAIIGGDQRMIYLAELLNKENTVSTFYQELAHNTLVNAGNIEEVIDKSDVVIGPIPLSKDGENVFTEFSEKKVSVKGFIQKCKGKTLIAGAISRELIKLAKDNNVKIIDLMENESLAILNAIATAEGTIEIAIRKTNCNIHGSKILILGFGRVAKIVAEKFAGLSAIVTCAARKPEAISWIEAYGYKYKNINKLGANLKEYDVIINTPPTLILDREKLKFLKEDCLVIDLASKPGGVDRDTIKELKINFEWALALPGKVAPKASAEYIMKTLKLLGTEEKSFKLRRDD